MNILIEQGLNLMLYGMGMVFCFLGLLTVAIYLMSSVLQRWFPPVVEDTPPSTNPARQSSVIPATTLKVIQAAIDQHRTR